GHVLDLRGWSLADGFARARGDRERGRAGGEFRGEGSATRAPGATGGGRGADRRASGRCGAERSCESGLGGAERSRRPLRAHGRSRIFRARMNRTQQSTPLSPAGATAPAPATVRTNLGLLTMVLVWGLNF